MSSPDKRGRLVAMRLGWTEQDIVYRVSYDVDSDTYKMVSFGMQPDDGTEGTYSGFSSLPTWVQERLSVLSITKSPPPVVDVPGVGRRMGDNLYWVYKG